MTRVRQASLRSGKPYDLEFRIRDRDGHWRWIRSHSRARRGEDGRITHWYGVGEDIDLLCPFPAEEMTAPHEVSRDVG